MCCRWRQRDHEIITTNIDGKKKLLLSSISFRISCHPRKRTRKVERGKKLLDTQTEEDPSNLRHKQSSWVRSSLSRESKKVKKKKKKKKKKKIKKRNRNTCRGMTKFVILFDNVGNGIEIKGLFDPAHSCHGLSLYWFIGLFENRYS